MRWLAGMAVALVLGAGAWCPLASAQDTHVGWIVQIDANCDGRLRAKDSAEAKQLDAAADHYRFLYPGESVRCEGMGTMSMQVLDRDVKKISKRDGWCTIHEEEAVCEKEAIRKPKVAANSVGDRALREFGRPAGRQRGFHSSIFWPATGSTVRVGEFVVRWNGISGATRISLRLTDKYHEVLWEREDVDATAMELTDPASRSALLEYRNKGGAGPFTLSLIKDGTAEPAATFSTLSTEDEQALDLELASCENKKGLLRHVCRTFAFSRRAMWNDAAKEYEDALRLAPESRDLTLAALAAETSVGNAKRMAELRAKLPPGTPLPE